MTRRLYGRRNQMPVANVCDYATVPDALSQKPRDNLTNLDVTNLNYRLPSKNLDLSSYNLEVNNTH